MNPAVDPETGGCGRVAAILPVCISGVLSALTVSGYDFFWLAWFAWIPLLLTIQGAKPRRAFVLGGIAGTVQSLALWHWLAPVSARMSGTAWAGGCLLVCLCLFDALLFGAFGALAALIDRGPPQRLKLPGCLGRILAIGCLWVAFEYARNTAMMAASLVFPHSTGYALWAHPAMIQLAAATGVYGLSFVIIVFNAAAAGCVSKRDARPLLCAIGVVAVCVGCGRLRVSSGASAGGAVSATRVAVLQGNIPAHDKFDRSKADRLAQRYIELGAEAARARPDLIVWTESAIPWPLREDDDLMNAMLRVTQPSGACHLLGATAAVGADGNLFANSALVVQPDGAITARYDKRHLVTFAEKPARLPLLSPFGLIHPENRAYTRGTGPPVLRTPVGRAGIMICNENLYPPLARACVRHGAEFLVQMANGAWIDAPAAVRQHFAVNTLRAVETGRDVVVANNAGVSALIDARGRVLARSPIGTAACLQGTIIRRTRPTLYARTGDAFAWLCLVAGAGSVWFAHRRERITATV